MPLILLIAAFLGSLPFIRARTAGPEGARHTPIGDESSASRGEHASLDDVRTLIRKDGDYSGAESLAREILAREEAAHGEESLQVARVLDLLVEAIQRGGRAKDPEATESAERALKIKRAVLPPNHQEISATLNQLAWLKREIGRPHEALGFFKEALEIREGHYAEDPLPVAWASENYATALLDLGRFEEARPYFERGLEITVRERAPGHPEVAGSKYNLARVLWRLGFYSRSKALFTDALEITVENSGPEHRHVAWVLTGFASMLHRTGEYAAARERLERALAIATKLEDRYFMAEILNNLGLVHRDLVDYVAAESFYRRSREEALESRGRMHSSVARAIKNLGEVYHLTGDYERAGSLYREAMAIRTEVLGPEHPSVAATQEALAALLADTGDYPASKERYEAALAIWKKSLDLDHPAFARVSNALASVLVEMGDSAAARARYIQAMLIRERSFGSTHPLMAEIFANLAMLLAGSGQSSDALNLALRAERISRENVRLTARSLPDRQALRYAAVQASGLHLALAIAADSGDGAIHRRAWDSLIRSRALILDEMVSRHRSVGGADDPEVSRLLEDLSAASKRYANLVVRGPDPEHPEQYRGLLRGARAAMEEAERALARKSAAFEGERTRERIGMWEVAGSVPSGSALVGLAFCEPPVAAGERAGRAGAGARRSATGPRSGRARPRSFYLAFVLRSGMADPELVRLGYGERIEDLILRWTEAAGREIPAAGGAAERQEGASRGIGDDLRRAVWDPLVPLLGNAERVFIVPDGALHSLNFAALPVGEDGYLVESGPLIHYLASERGLVPADERPSPGRGLLLVGGAAFGAIDDSVAQAGGARSAGRGERPGSGDQGSSGGALAECPAFREHRFPDLPASAREAAEIAALWERAGESSGTVRGREGTAGGERSDDVRLLEGAAATEAAFKDAAPGRRVLHLSTHGFFLDDRCPSITASLRSHRGIGFLSHAAEPPPRPLVGDNPLRLSGLALAGANRRSDAGPDEEDGILTAEEAAAMNLAGVDWAVLSACQTGAGEVRTGEGVIGLRRAFRVAGASTVIMNLWSVEDQAAREWMRALYEASLLEGLGTAEAVREASRRVIRRRRSEGVSTDPHYWGGWIASGEWR